MNISILKNFWRALRIFYHLCQKTMIFEFSQRCEIRRAPRAKVRARQKFFWKCNLHDKISLQFFLFGHNSKSEFFRAIWRLKFLNSIFSKKLENSKILKIFQKKSNFFEKTHISKALTLINSTDMKIFKIRRM